MKNDIDPSGMDFLKALDMFGNCQRPVFSLCVHHNMHKIKNLGKVGLYWLSKLQENNERKKHKFVCFQMPNKRL